MSEDKYISHDHEKKIVRPLKKLIQLLINDIRRRKFVGVDIQSRDAWRKGCKNWWTLLAETNTESSKLKKQMEDNDFYLPESYMAGLMSLRNCYCFYFVPEWPLRR